MKKKHSSIALLSLLFAGGLCYGCTNDSPNSFYNDDVISDAVTSDGTSTSDDANTDSAPEGMDLVFYDDFTGTDSIPDQSKWKLCEKGTSTWARYLSESYAQAYQKDGVLHLFGELVDGEYKTAGVETLGKFEFEYGEVQVRAKFARMPQGNHCGIWMMPAPPAQKWPMSGEIDIMEHINATEYVYATTHSWYIDETDPKHVDDPLSHKVGVVNQNDWNVYGLKWTPESITYTVNGETLLTYPNLHLDGENGAYQWPFNHPFYLILSQSLGGEGTWEGPIDNSELPAEFQIDWVKIYQSNGNTGITPIYPD